MPPVGALDRLRAANGDDGFVGRARSSPRLLVGIAGGALLVMAWIGWAIYVTSDHGARAGLGVIIAWPAALAALALISLPFVGAYLLIRRLAASEEDGGTATAESETPDADDVDEEEDSGDKAEGSADEDEDSEEDEDSDEADEPESSAKGSSKS